MSQSFVTFVGVPAVTGKETNQSDQHSEKEREELRSSQQGECSGTVEKLLNISLQEENVRNRIMQTDKAIQELRMLLMQTQQQLQSKMVFRDQVKRCLIH